MPDPALNSPAATHRPGTDPRAAVLTIGTFDGVHVGHRALLERARKLAAPAGGRASARVVALAFDPNPLEVLSPAGAPARLTTWAQRDRLLRGAGADEVVRLDPTPALLALSPEGFVDQLESQYRPVAVVEGADFRFGAKRAGDVALLRSLGAARGFSVDVVGQVECALNDHTIAPARSSVIRWLIANGRVSDAARLLGRPYAMAGTVRRGDQRGRTIGYPTVNVESPCLAPADGVYAGRARLPDGRTLAAAISVGTKPTFGPHARAVEAFVMEARVGENGRTPAKADLSALPDYGWEMELEFLAFVRDQVRFDTLDELLGQMGRDCAACLSIAETAAACETCTTGA